LIVCSSNKNELSIELISVVATNVTTQFIEFTMPNLNFKRALPYKAILLVISRSIGGSGAVNIARNRQFLIVQIKMIAQSISESDCQAWENLQDNPIIWTQDLPACPPFLNPNLALPPGENFWQVDLSCNRNSILKLFISLSHQIDNCTLHPGAFQCIRSSFSNQFGAGQQCCYSIGGGLLLDGTGSGNADRYQLGISLQSFLNHFLQDVIPYLACCVFSNNCIIYTQLRPSCDSLGIRCTTGPWRAPPPNVPIVFGDPHFGTLDGTRFLFNGFGEYTLLRIPQILFESQARMLPASSTFAATQVTAVRY